MLIFELYILKTLFECFLHTAAHLFSEKLHQSFYFDALELLHLQLFYVANVSCILQLYYSMFCATSSNTRNDPTIKVHFEKFLFGYIHIFTLIVIYTFILLLARPRFPFYLPGDIKIRCKIFVNYVLNYYIN